MTEYVKQEKNLNDNYPKFYALIFGQCTKHMRSKLEAREYYQMVSGGYNMFLLMTSIKGLTFQFDRHKNPLHTLHNAKRDFY